MDGSLVVKLNGSNTYKISHVHQCINIDVHVSAMIVSPNEEEDPKVLRKRAGLTVRTVAEALDVTITTVTRWESGSSTPTLSLKQTSKLMKLYGCSIDQLDRAFTQARRNRELKDQLVAEREISTSTASRI